VSLLAAGAGLAIVLTGALAAAVAARRRRDRRLLADRVAGRLAALIAGVPDPPPSVAAGPIRPADPAEHGPNVREPA
jgi:hypothetical protein